MEHAAVLRGIARALLLPVAVRVLRGEDRGDRLGRHRGRSRLDDLGVVRGATEQTLQGEVPHSRDVRLEQPRGDAAVELLHRSTEPHATHSGDVPVGTIRAAEGSRRDRPKARGSWPLGRHDETSCQVPVRLVCHGRTVR
jgi:hypothetical protein